MNKISSEIEQLIILILPMAVSIRNKKRTIFKVHIVNAFCNKIKMKYST